MVKAKRPRRLTGATYEITTGCGRVYVTCNNDASGRLFEVFARLGKSGGCGSAVMEGLSRTISVGLRSGVSPHDLVKTLQGNQCHRGLSCVSALADAVLEHGETEEEGG